MENQSVEEGKTIAIISYLTLIGLIIAFVMNNDKKNDFASFHIRQSIGIFTLFFMSFIFLFIIAFIVYIPFLSTIVNSLIFVLWVLGFIGSLQGEKKKVPIVGEHFQEWFKNIG